MRITVTLLLACLALTHADSATRCEREACDKVKADIREIEARMRSGYTNAQGQRYERRLRRLRDKRRRVCR